MIEVTGRTYPVEVRYRPIETGDQVQAIVDAVGGAVRAEPSDGGPGDVLVFLSGEREIHDTADALRRLGPVADQLEVLPLYARLVVGRAAPDLRAAGQPVEASDRARPPTSPRRR